MGVDSRIERLDDWIDELKKMPKSRFSEYFVYDGGRIKIQKREELEVRGCYLIYQKGKSLPIYVGSNRSQERTAIERLKAILYGRGHPLPKKLVKDLFYKGQERKIRTKDVMSNKEKYRGYCLEKLSFKILENERRPLAMEIGLIYVFRPKYNSESKKFE